MKSTRLYQNIRLQTGEQVSLDVQATKHLLKVLRFCEGQNVTLFNGDGMNYQAKIIKAQKNCIVEIYEKIQNLSESKLDLTLAQCILKGEKTDFVMQKAVELGVNTIIPIVSSRVIVRLTNDKAVKRQQHWQKIVVSACEQSGRSIVPKVLMPIDFTDFINTNNAKHNFILHHLATDNLIDESNINKITALIGPEGGFSDTELSHAIKSGYKALRLYSRVLRAETAALATIANMQLLWDN